MNNVNFEKLYLSVDDVSCDGITLAIKNKSDFSYGYGAFFRLEKRTGENDWVSVLPLEGVSWVQEDWISFVGPNENASISYTWDWYYGHIASGDYRILVEFSTEDRSSVSMVTAPFAVK